MLLIKLFCEMKFYRGRNCAPVAIIATGGLVTIFQMIRTIGLSVFQFWCFYPSMLVTLFALFCLFRPQLKPWHQILWRICQVWTGIWAVLIFTLPIWPIWLVFGRLLNGLLGDPLFEQIEINPFLALFLHVLFWCCITDILRSIRKPTEQVGAGNPLPAE